MRVLAVDDSALMRRWLSECFASDPSIECLTARDGVDALSKIASFDPDVVTLDINMPAMDGMTCLSRIMTEAPRPVVMLSSLTEEGALATFEALELGAVDFIAKPGGTVSHDLKSVFPEILAKVRAAARARTRRPRVARPQRPEARTIPRTQGRPDDPARTLRKSTQPQGPVAFDLILVGSSTGGPSALEEVLRPLDSDFPVPVLVAQHMPRRFTGVFSRRLSDQGGIAVVEVSGTSELRPGQVYLAQGDADIVVSRRGDRLVASSVPRDPSRIWSPSVNRMVESALATVPPRRMVGVLLTGMGDDGADSMARLRAEGGRTIAESEGSCAIFGMPKELIARGGAEKVLDAGDIAAALCRLVNH